MGTKNNILLVGSGSFSDSTTAALAALLQARVAPAGKGFTPEPGETVVFLDARVVFDSEELRDAVVCVPPEAPPRSIRHLSRHCADGTIRRLVVHTPVHHLFALERLRWSATEVELIPPCMDTAQYRPSRVKRDTGMLLALDFEGCDRGIIARANISREARVESLRFDSSDQVRDALQRAGVVLVASGERETGSGARELLAAMSCGAPIVASRTWGLECLMVDEAEGLLYETGEAGHAQQAIRRLLSDPDLAAKLGSTAARKVARFLTLEHYAERLRCIIRSPRGKDSPNFFLIPAHARAGLPGG